jgi:hypothetical protein
VPNRTLQKLFYPFIDGKKVTERDLRNKFRKTWAYLQKNRSRLEERTITSRSGKAWWEPTRPREPEALFRPKLVVPHLVIMPRFALDARGRFAVSRSPFLIARVSDDEQRLLKLMLAILNSPICSWYLQTHSHVYRHGYTMLEPGTLSRTPVPNVNRWSTAEKKQLLRLVDARLRAEDGQRERLNSEIDQFVSDAYGLSATERKALGL